MISFLVPFRDVDGTRTRVADWILGRWQHYFPDAEFCIAPDDGIDPFNKSLAVNNAAKLATGDIFVILDCDTWVSGVGYEGGDWMRKAIRQLGRSAWVIPARKSFRLTRTATDRILALPVDAELPRLVANRAMVEQSGSVVGFCHIVPREGFEKVGGMDERYRGWGGEDHSFVRALDVVHGPHIQMPGLVMSLWHARPRGAGGRTWEGQTAQHYADRVALAKRYTAARTTSKMLELLKR